MSINIKHLCSNLLITMYQINVTSCAGVVLNKEETAVGDLRQYFIVNNPGSKIHTC